MNVPMPSASARLARSSALSPGVTFSSRVISRGSRPAAGGLVDELVAAPQVPGLQVGERGQPAVRLAADEPEHPGLVGAHPDGDLVRGRGAALRSRDAVVIAVDAQCPTLARVPDAAHDVDRFVERVHGLPGR
jgi:hypothetical protein